MPLPYRSTALKTAVILSFHHSTTYEQNQSRPRPVFPLACPALARSPRRGRFGASQGLQMACGAGNAPFGANPRSTRCFCVPSSRDPRGSSVFALSLRSTLAIFRSCFPRVCKCFYGSGSYFLHVVFSTDLQKSGFYKLFSSRVRLQKWLKSSSGLGMFLSGELRSLCREQPAAAGFLSLMYSSGRDCR